MPKRNNTDEKQILRHWLILKQMCHEAGIFKQQLIHRTKASERTIERDIKILSKCFPIRREKVGREIKFSLDRCPLCNNKIETNETEQN